MTKRLIFALTLLTGFFISGCIHDKFDEPPGGGADPDIDENFVISIEDLKNMYDGGDAYLITDSVFIKGIVVADDKSGNFYQTIVMEDASAGVALRIETSDFFNIYPVGRRVFVLVKGLYIGQYNGLVQIGVRDPEEADGVARIPNLLVEDYFFPGMYNLPVVPADVTISELNSDREGYQNRLIRLSGMEFSCDDLGETYATDSDISSAVNRVAYNCDGGSILLRNSSYSEFALELLPEGNGTLTAIFSVFGTDNQLLIRDTDDLVFDQERCLSEVVTGLEEDFENAEVFEPISVNNWQSIGIIGSEAWQGRSFGGNTYAQIQGFSSDYPQIESWLVSPKIDFSMVDVMTFETKIGYWTNDGLEVFISTDFNGCDAASATWTELTDAVIANSVNSPSGVGGYADFYTQSGDVDLTSFTGVGVIGFKYTGDNSANTTTYQLDNVIVGSPPPVNCDLTSLDEDFNDISTSGNFDLECWQNVAITGSEYWEGRSFSGNSYPQISGFNSSSTEIETYLISPPIDLSGVSTLNFDSKAAFCNHEGLIVAISTDFDGVDIGAANWTTLNSAVISDSDCASGYPDNFTNSGDVDISGFSGTGYFAFIYNGNNSDETTTYQVDNVSVQ